MDDDILHKAFAAVVDASFAFTMAFNEHGADSQQAHDAFTSYQGAMEDYKAVNGPFEREKCWDHFCALHPGAIECKVYDV